MPLKESNETSEKSSVLDKQEQQRYDFFMEHKKLKNPSSDGAAAVKENSVKSPRGDEKLVAKAKSPDNHVADEKSKQEKSKDEKTNKNRYDPKKDMDMFSWNCAQLDNFLKAKNEK